MIEKASNTICTICKQRSKPCSPVYNVMYNVICQGLISLTNARKVVRERVPYHAEFQLGAMQGFFALEWSEKLRQSEILKKVVHDTECPSTGASSSFAVTSLRHMGQIRLSSKINQLLRHDEWKRCWHGPEEIICRPSSSIQMGQSSIFCSAPALASFKALTALAVSEDTFEADAPVERV